MIKRLISKFEIKEIARFLVGGGTAVVIDAAVYALLKGAFGVSVSKAISYIAGAAAGFFINKFWTFESRALRISEIVRYIILYAVSAGINTFVNKLVLLFTGSTAFSFLCATGVSTIINFIGQKFFVFRKENNK